MKVKFIKLNKEATVPTYGTEYSAGADLYACNGGKTLEIGAGQSLLIHTGIAVEIPNGYVGLIFARSGISVKRGLAPANKVGVIDSDYRGELMVSLYNQSGVTQSVEDKERIAQLAIVPYIKAEFEETDTLEDTERSSGGFGSTGKK